METRKITVVSTQLQKQVKIDSKAVTLGDLKQELRALNIPYYNMSFLEGHLKAEFTDNSAILPLEVPHKGGMTNELVFLLTNTKKKIESGSERTDILNKIKEHKLQEECVARYGKNFTNCKTAELKELLDDCTMTPPELANTQYNNVFNKASEPTSKRKPKEVVETPETIGNVSKAYTLVDIVKELIDMHRDQIQKVDYQAMMHALEEKTMVVEKKGKGETQLEEIENEVADLFNL